jgi:hypothetical protein
MDSSELIWAIIIVTLILLIVFGIVYKSHWEGFIPVSNNPVVNGDIVNIDSDDLGLSDYGNISLSGDIDSMQQRVIGLDFPPDLSEKIDNSDVIAQIVNRGDTVFQPSHAYGVSTTTNASLTPMVIASRSNLPYLDDESSYDSPTGALTIDEKLAISQQHRGAQSKRAIDGYVRSTRNLYEKYFTNELDESARVKEGWWGQSSDDTLETDFGPDIDPM